MARAVAWATKLVFMDEPTAALASSSAGGIDADPHGTRPGRPVVLISHNMPEVLPVADRIEVLRLGRRVAQVPAADTTRQELVAAMTGGSDQEDAA